MAEIILTTHARNEFLNLTAEINRRLPPDLSCGLCHLFTLHTTAGLMINENADPDVQHDLLAKLARLLPDDEPFYQHAEGNSAAHLKSLLTGVSLTLPVRYGHLALGTWQGVYFCEFDGPRTRKLQLSWWRTEA